MTRQGHVLVVDDEEIMREILEALLTREGYQVRLAASGQEGLDLARSMTFDAAILDVMMPGIDGITALEELRKFDEDLPVIMITAFASVESAIGAMKRGAFDYITKPFKNDEVIAVLKNAVERRQLVVENRALKQNLQARYHKFANIIGKSPKMRQVFDLIIQAAPSRSTVLVYGESGTGKELVARAIHTNSARADKPFVTVNSGSLPPDLLESNLFGHVKGAFTGAVYPKKGLFELADKGSIFFDEIGNVPLETQAKLLRVIQEREFMRLGGVETIKVDVRIIAATNVDLRKMMEDVEVPRGPLLPAPRHHGDACRRCASARKTSRCCRSTSWRSTARRTPRRGWNSPPRRSTCSSSTTGRATSASSRTSSSAPSCCPRHRAWASTSSPITSARRARSTSPPSTCRRRASRSRKWSAISSDG